MNSGVIVGILLMVLAVIVFLMKISGEEIVMKIAAAAIMVAGLTFLADGITRKK